MSKLIAATAAGVAFVLAIAIASLVISIITLTNTNSIKTNTQPVAQPAAPVYVPQNAAGNISQAQGFKDAANYILNGMDNTVDPCNDFYGFTCNKYIGSVNLEQLGLGRLGTYDQAQVTVDGIIRDSAAQITDKDTKTEQIVKKVIDSCRNDSDYQDMTVTINKELNTLFGGIPFMNGKLKANVDLIQVSGILEQTHAVPTLLASYASIDYKVITRNALFINQPSLSLPLDYYIKPQFTDKLVDHQAAYAQVMAAYWSDMNNGATPTNETLVALSKSAKAVVDFEVLIAMASWSDDLLRNYRQQYNQYFLNTLTVAYPNIKWTTYMGALFDGVQPSNNNTINTNSYIIGQPSYFAWLDTVFQGHSVPQDAIANYMILQVIIDDAGFYPAGDSNRLSTLVRQHDYVSAVHRRGLGVSRIGRREHRKFDNEDPAIGCVDMLMAFMPYGPGYTYIKSQVKTRNATVADIKIQTGLIIESFKEMIGTLSWMTNETKTHSYKKADNLRQNYGWPIDLYGFNLEKTQNLDDYHSDYMSILQANSSNFYGILMILKKGLQVRETYRLLNQVGDRNNFLSSPATVNAWYQPERNSITFPYGIWNPPYYNLQYPQAYNYAGQGGTAGHELTHGFDDEGVQFDFDGSLTGCDGNYKCGWMDPSSGDGFTNMAQCVVSQYSTQCCPEKTGNVHCANGATTQGENIADLGGQQAAYSAYQKYIERYRKGIQEDRLPGLEAYTPTQIFWMTYGYSWCMKQTDDNLVKQLLTNPHSPGSCRTNQVMQDIPSFGNDFKCKQGSQMYPMPSGRCMVWVGY